MSAGPDPIDPEMTRIVDALSALAPARGPIDRDRILYAAGRAEGLRLAPRRRGWPAVAAGLALIASGEAALLLRDPSTHVIERVVVIREPAPMPNPDPAPPAVLPASDPSPPRPWGSPGLVWTPRDRLADQVIRYGLDGLPASPPLVAREDPDPGFDELGRRPRIDPFRLLFAPGDPS